MKSYDNDEFMIAPTPPRVEICGNNRCVVEGLKSIESYNQDMMRFNLGKYYLSLYGSDMRIQSFSVDGAIICGDIISLEFDTNG